MNPIPGQTGWIGNKPFWPKELWGEEIRYGQRELFEEMVHNSDPRSHSGLMAWGLMGKLDYRFPSVTHIEDAMLDWGFL